MTEKDLKEKADYQHGKLGVMTSSNVFGVINHKEGEGWIMKYTVLLLVGNGFAHSWLDCIGLDIPYLGPQQYYSTEFYRDYCIGYGRGYPGRSNIDINTLFTFLVEGRGMPDPSTKEVCTQQNYSYQFPMATLATGTRIKLWYEMDNHLIPQTTAHLYGFAIPSKPITTYRDQSQAIKLLTHPFATSQNCID
ncbi:hypothetical protein L0F63_002956, partial [Massospora cicadina]